MFEKKIKKFCNNNNYQYISLLHFNERKKSAVAVLKLNRKELIGKFIFDSSFKQELMKEKEFYLKNANNSHIPALIEANDTYLIIEKVEGSTLLEYLSSHVLDKTEKNDIILQVLAILHSFNKNEINYCNTNIDLKRFANALLNKFKVLIFSGPINTNKNNFLYSFLARGFFYILLPLIKSNILRVLNSLIIKQVDFGGIYHGDFHLNNILIDNNAKLIAIDFEKTQYEPFFLADLSFIMGIISAKLNISNIKEFSNLQKEINLVYSPYLIDLFSFAAKVNPRFNNHTDYKAILSLFKLIVFRKNEN